MDGLQKRLLASFQRGVPLTPTPYAKMAEQLGADEEGVLAALAALMQDGVISRIGPVFRTSRIGAGTLAAMQVPAERLDEVASIVSSFDAVNHNYEREHRFNLWFVVVAADEGQVQATLAEIERRAMLPVMSLPMLEEYHIDLGFPLQWD